MPACTPQPAEMVLTGSGAPRRRGGGLRKGRRLSKLEPTQVRANQMRYSGCGAGGRPIWARRERRARGGDGWGIEDSYGRCVMPWAGGLSVGGGTARGVAGGGKEYGREGRYAELTPPPCPWRPPRSSPGCGWAPPGTAPAAEEKVGGRWVGGRGWTAGLRAGPRRRGPQRRGQRRRGQRSALPEAPQACQQAARAAQRRRPTAPPRRQLPTQHARPAPPSRTCIVYCARPLVMPRSVDT